MCGFQVSCSVSVLCPSSGLQLLPVRRADRWISGGGLFLGAGERIHLQTPRSAAGDIRLHWHPGGDGEQALSCYVQARWELTTLMPHWRYKRHCCSDGYKLVAIYFLLCSSSKHSGLPCTCQGLSLCLGCFQVYFCNKISRFIFTSKKYSWIKHWQTYPFKQPLFLSSYVWLQWWQFENRAV